MLRRLLPLAALWLACPSYPQDPNADGGTRLPDGSVLLPDGGVMLPDGGVASADGGTSLANGGRDTLFTAQVSAVVFEVDYQAGAVPYDNWWPFRFNVKALFSEAPRTIVVSDKIYDWERLDDVSGATFSGSQILAIADRHRSGVSTQTRRSYYLLFLDGLFDDDGSAKGNPNILGVSLGDTGVIAIFKPVVDGTRQTALDTETPKLVEQLTLIHEFGHAAGLVDNGIPMATPHRDAAHGAHCDDPNCVMSWAIESDPLKTAEFAIRTLSGSFSEVVFDAHCLDDANAAAHP